MQLNADHGIPMFSYVWLSDVPHSNDHALLVLDDPVHELIRDMQERRAFENTALVLLSDHGARFGSNHATVIGRQEDKTPGLSLLGHVPPERNCSDAFVPVEFCECVAAGVHLDLQSNLVQSFATFLVEYVNRLNEANFPAMCVR
ncbi:hypothetical protein HPB52_013724 [Rhipicephalus sanguineus]|uniref:Uncharacterized protein n=1 Tax=Rhipicephalus sanguineus TaxID=34632 RepID=A0A9D4SSL6_RHISA|nr:hypothetical protein HPB52_013724 [Rhipicephalus sanguineus]